MIVPGIVASRQYGGAAPGVVDVPAPLFSGGSLIRQTPIGAGLLDAQRVVTWSCWIKKTASPTTLTNFWGIYASAGQNRVLLRITSGSKYQVFIANETTGAILNVTSSLNVNYNAWNHLYATVNMNGATTPDRIKFYINGVYDTSPAMTTFISANINFKRSGYRMDFGGFTGELQHFWMVQSNLDIPTAFYSGTSPANIGVNGEIPTGSTPLYYMRGVSSVWNAGTNFGTNGDFSTITPTIDGTSTSISWA